MDEKFGKKDQQDCSSIRKKWGFEDTREPDDNLRKTIPVRH